MQFKNFKVLWYSLQVVLCNSKSLGVSINISVQSIIYESLWKHENRWGVTAKVVPGSGIKMKDFKTSADALNHEWNGKMRSLKPRGHGSIFSGDSNKFDFVEIAWKLYRVATYMSTFEKQQF